MAGAHCATTTSSAVTAHLHRRHYFSTASLIPRKPIFIVSSFDAPFPTKSTKRKNYLRPKILKTLKKPFIPKLPSTVPVISIDFPTRQEEVKEPEDTKIQEFDEFENQESIESEETEIQELDKFVNQELREAKVSGSSGVIVDGSIGRFHKNTLLRYGLCLVGAFVFHTVCTAWIFGSADLDGKDRIFRGNDKDGYPGLDEKGKNKSKVELFLNGNGNGNMDFENGGVNSVVFMDEVEMERKIKEIRTMAKEARERESKNNGFDSEEKDDIDDGKFIKSGIEKEVDNRLIKLQKKLEKSRKKLPVSSVGILRTAGERNNGVEKDKLGDREGNGALMFKKKYKFKGLSNNLDEKPKGFMNSEYDSFNKFKQKGNVEKGNELLKSGNGNEDKWESDLIHLEEDGEKKGTQEVNVSSNSITKKLVKEKGTRKPRKNGVAIPKMKNGIVQDKSDEIPTVKSMKSRKSKAESMKLSESAQSNKMLYGKEVGNTQAANNIEDIKSESETDFWWLNLPYVLGILMHRGHEEGRHGLYTLKSTSSAGGDFSHTVAFEDCGDAINFCCLLQSYFGDLKDFGAEIVPLKIADLHGAVKSHTMRLVVVKKGQLQLYVGQPLADAEMALRALIKGVAWVRLIRQGGDVEVNVIAAGETSLQGQFTPEDGFGIKTGTRLSKRS
ncbi:embryo defective [Forsythia ovata]|uniref:Embryo defective n=1 Tax=Forsythia ovata TaxID=205694 RepID=A0ABD1PJH6_9LAMI